jgi:hypothetical protein
VTKPAITELRVVIAEGVDCDELWLDTPIGWIPFGYIDNSSAAQHIAVVLLDGPSGYGTAKYRMPEDGPAVSLRITIIYDLARNYYIVHNRLNCPLRRGDVYALASALREDQMKRPLLEAVIKHQLIAHTRHLKHEYEKIKRPA